MNVYTLDDERAIRQGRLVNEWAASSLVSDQQRDAMMPELEVDLRRTNRFLRVTLFGFGLLIIVAAIGLLFITLDLDNPGPVATVCLIGAAGMYALARRLATAYRFYRFGFEEAAAIVAVAMFGIAAAGVTATIVEDRSTGVGAIGCAAASLAALIVFLTFGYRYAALAGMVTAAAIPMQIGETEWAQRLAAMLILGGVFLSARTQARQHGDEYPGDAFAAIEAWAFAGMYLVIHLRLASLVAEWWLGFDRVTETSGAFYWSTYAGIWLLPAAGLWLAIRDRHRWLLRVSIALALVTLMSNKPYLNAPRQAWDPLVFGVFLMAVGVGLRRWLAAGADGTRAGFTASRVLASDRDNVGVVGIASAAHQPGPIASTAAPPDVGAGGRSGGGGAGGSF